MGRLKLRDDEIECLFVFLLIRGLGKSKALLHLLSKMENKQCSSAEQAGANPLHAYKYPNTISKRGYFVM